MILKELSELIYIDENEITPLNNSKDYTHFLSFASNFYVLENFNSYFYTSKQIAEFICECRHKDVPSKFVKLLNLNETQHITLSNCEELEVTIFSDEKITACLCYYFKYKNDITALYMGHFRNISVLENNKVFMDLITNGVNYVYLDNTRIGSSYYTFHSIIDVIREIKAIFLAYPNYKICMGLPLFGCEELVENLLKYYKISINHKIQKIYNKCYPNVNFYGMKNADIILCKDTATVEQLKERFTEKKVITIRLLEKSKHKLEGMNQDLGIKSIFYSPHMKTGDLRLIIELTQPFNIKDIYSADDKIPNFYKQASLNWVKQNKDYEESGLSLLEVDIPNMCSTILRDKSRIFDTEQRKTFRSRRSSTNSYTNLENEMDALMFTDITKFNGKRPISNIFHKDYMLPKRKKNKKQITVRPIIEVMSDEIKVEASVDFDMSHVESFTQLLTQPTLANNYCNQLVHSWQNNYNPAPEPEPEPIDCPIKKQMQDLILKAYVLQMNKKQQLKSDILNEPLNLELLNNAEINCSEMQDEIIVKENENRGVKDVNKPKMDENENLKITNNNKSITNITGAQTSNILSEPLNLELLNNAEVDCSEMQDEIIVKKSANRVTKDMKKLKTYENKRLRMRNKNKAITNITGALTSSISNEPLDLELLNNADADVDSDCIEIVEPTQKIVVADDKVDRHVRTTVKNPYHILYYKKDKINLNSRKAITYLDE